MTSDKPTFLELRWKGGGWPITINVKSISSIRRPTDGEGCTIAHGADKSCTVTATYEEILDILDKHATIIKL